MTKKNEREYARFGVYLRARFRVLETAEEVEGLRKTLLDHPSVWVPSGLTQVEKLAATGRGSDGTLARAVLDLTTQIEQITHRLVDLGGPMEVGNLAQLSGNGGQLGTSLMLEAGTKLDLRIMDDALEAPPVRSLVELVHGRAEPPDRYGFRFVVIHAFDRERLIRYLYQLQRRKLRKAHIDKH